MSHRTKAVMKLAAGRHFLLTGSPLLNHVNELWPLLHRIDPGEWPNYWGFVSRYAVFGGFKAKEIVGVKNQAELTERLNAVMIRRRKADVLDLPDKQHVQVWVDLHPEQRKLYDQAQDELIMSLPGDPDPLELENALTKFLRLKQVCGTTFNLTYGTDRIADSTDYSTKLDRAVEMIQELIDNGDRVVVFTQFRGTLAALTGRLDRVGVPVHTLHGDVPAAERAPRVAAWGSAEPGALIAMLQVAGVGLNMTQARHCIFLDKLFVPKLNEQAEDRLHRIGADKSHQGIGVPIVPLIGSSCPVGSPLAGPGTARRAASADRRLIPTPLPTPGHAAFRTRRSSGCGSEDGTSDSHLIP